MYRKKGYIIARIVGLLAVLLMAFIVAIQTPLVQTRLSKFALNQLAAIMDGRVQYDEIKVMTSGVIVIRNLKLIDTHPYAEDINGRGWAPADTVAHIDKLTATFGLSGLFRKEGLHMGRVTIEGGSFHLVSEPGEEYHDNLSRIFHLQASDAPPSRDNVFDIKKLRIKDFRFRMNSFLPDHGTYKGFGVNFDDLDITLDLTAYKFAIADAKIRGDIERLTAREKSGYVIENLTSSCEFGFVDGALTLIDECLTPDSSRFWPAQDYEAGVVQPSYDKQFVRDWLRSNWDMKGEPPHLPTSIVEGTSERYKEAYRIITGEAFVPAKEQ